MVIDPLLTILKAPHAPRETGTTNGWGDVSRRLGEVLPGDYMKFIEFYGTGVIADWLTVLNPFAENRHQNLFIAGFEFLASLREIKAAFPKSVPYPLFYEPGGLLPWGISIDGDIFCWLTRGLAAGWPVVITGRHTPPEEFPLQMTQFLFETLCGKIQPLCVADDLKPTFVDILANEN